MADLTFVKAIVDNKHQITANILNFSSADNDLITKFGDPILETGGEILDGGSVLRASLTPKTVNLKSGFVNFFIEFTTINHSDPRLVADTWIFRMKARVAALLTTLRANNDTFTGTDTTTV
jgi:hypothetical protein